MGYSKKSDEITREYFDSILISTRYLDSDLPDLSTELFGERFETPVTTAALSHLHKVCEDGMVEFAKGAFNAGAMHFYGMGEDEELERVINTGAKTAKIIKPHADDKEVFRRIEHAKKAGAFAVGMDIDHAISWEGKYDCVLGLDMRPKTTEQIKEYVQAAGDTPFIVKGVLSACDAEKVVKAGAKGIVVSHHHGIMDYMTPPLMMLPEIKEAVGNQAKIFIDCGIESGADVFKCLALGADAVSVGRALMGPLEKGNTGVTDTIKRINSELTVIMARTGAKSIKEIDSSVLRYRSF